MKNNLTHSLILLKQVAHKLNDNQIDRKDIHFEIVAMFLNRFIIDIESAILLTSNGYYGSSKSLLAVTYRSTRMFASLITADPERLQKFWDEEEDTYHDKVSGFRKEFGENNSAKLAQDTLGDETAFNMIELEKILHGSCYSIRRNYSDIVIKDSLRIPAIKFGAFKNEDLETASLDLIEAFVIDILGVFFTRYKDAEYLAEEFDVYMKLGSIAKQRVQDDLKEMKS